MASFFAQGRLGTELMNQPLYMLWLFVKHSQHGDPWLKGETLEVIIQQIAKLENKEVLEVKEQVLAILKEKEELTLCNVKLKQD